MLVSVRTIEDLTKIGYSRLYNKLRHREALECSRIIERALAQSLEVIV